MKLTTQDKYGLMWVAIVLLVLAWIAVNQRFGIVS